ncbi:MAG TPA: hypothetical protein ENF73_03895 [Proteobacteria bacterium]|nr:hypothetical protein [Pseudomonadota bacterium]
MGKYCSLEIDGDNYYISYHHKDQGLKFAQFTGAGWNIEVVDDGENTGLYTSLVYLGGNFYISYYAEGQLRFAKKEGGSWEIEVVDSSADVGGYSTLVFDQNNNPMIAYYDFTNGDVKFAHFEDSAWNIEVVDSDGDVGRFVTMVYNEPFVHLFYYDNTYGNLKWAYKKPSGWQVTILYAEGDVGTWPSAYVSPMGHLHLAFQDEGNQDLIYGYLENIGTNWKFTKVDTEGYVGANVNILVRSGGPILIYQDQDWCDVKQATKSEDQWSTEAILSDGPFGFWMSAELDSEGQPHFCHFYIGSEDLLIWPPLGEE